MTFWDLAGEDEGADLQSLVESENPDISEILASSELITAFRIREEYLINFLIIPENIQKLLNVMFACDDIKKAKIAMQLFIGSESPVLKFFVENGELVEKTISAIDSYKYFQMGLLSQLYTCAFGRYPEIMADHFSNLTTIIKKLITKIDVKSISDLLHAYLDSLSPNKKWLPWVFLGILLPSEPNTVPDIFKNDEEQIRLFIHDARSMSFTKKQFSIMLEFIKDFISWNLDNEFVVSVISKYVDSLPMGPLRFEIALMVPKNTILYARAVKFAGAQTVSQHSVEALKYVTKYASENTVQVFPTLLANLTTKIINSFYFAEFVKLVEKLLEFDSFKIYIPSIMTAILQNATEDKWKKNIATVGFYLELSFIINPYCSSPEWDKFRNNEMKKWTTKDEIQESNTEIDITSFSVDGDTDGEIVGAEAPKEVEDVFGSGDFSKTFKKGQFASAFADINNGEFEISDPEDGHSKGDDSFGEIIDSPKSSKSNFNPEFPSTFTAKGKEEETDNIGGFFDNIDEKDNFKPEFPTSFPSVDAEKKDGDNIGGFFDNIDDSDKASEFNFKLEFPPATKKNENEATDGDNIGGFFTEANENKVEFVPEFPSKFPSTKAKEETDNIGGFFDGVDDDKDEDAFNPQFPSNIPSINDRRDETDNIGGFFDNIDEKDNFKPEFPTSFPSVEAEKKDGDNIGGFFDNIDDSDKASEFKPEFPPATKKSENEVTDGDNIGGFFTEANGSKVEFVPEFPSNFPSTKAKEETDNIGGFFDGVDDDKDEDAFNPQFPSNIPSINDRRDETDNIGGFFDNIDEKDNFKPEFPTSFPSAKAKEETDNIGGFFDNIDDGEGSEKAEETNEFKPQFPANFTTAEKKKEGSIDDGNNGGFEPEFPSNFPSMEEKREETDNIGGFFDNIDEKEETDNFKPEFPTSFPSAKAKEEETDNIGGFFDNIDEKDNFKPEFPTSFPSVEAEKKDGDNIGGFFDNIDNEEGNDDKFKPEFPSNFPSIEDKKEEGNIGGFFGEVSEKKEEFTPEFPTNFPSVEIDKKEETNDIGGFFDETETTAAVSGLSAIESGFGAASDFTESIDASQINASSIHETSESALPSQLAFPDVFPIHRDPTPVVDGFGSIEFPADVGSEDEANVSDVSSLSFAGGIAKIEFPADFGDAAAFGNDLSVSVANIIKYLDDPNWNSTAPDPHEFFAATDRFATEEDAFAFLTK